MIDCGNIISKKQKSPISKPGFKMNHVLIQLFVEELFDLSDYIIYLFIRHFRKHW